MKPGAVASAALHASVLVLPAVVGGRGGLAVRPQALSLVMLLLALAEVERGARRGLADPVGRGAAGARGALVSALGLFATVAVAIGWPWVVAPWSWWGALPVAVGIALRAAAIRTLGPGFTSETAAPLSVVNRGIYRVLAHPSEVGLVLIAGGAVVLGGSVAALAPSLLVVVPSVVVRVRAETRLLRAPAGPFRTLAGRENRAFSSG